MPIITLETECIKERQYQLIRGVSIGAGMIDEIVVDYEAPDRLWAAIINLGLACKYVVEKYPNYTKVIKLVSDGIYPDIKYGGEQNILYSLLHPFSDSEARKHKALYKDYARLLDRVNHYRYNYTIQINLIKGIKKD